MFVSNGNIKVKASIFNLPCKTTCKPGLRCRSYCYAHKAERIYPQVKPCRENNLEESKSDCFEHNLIDVLSKKKNPIVRLHESGDFYSLDYIHRIFHVCRNLPKKRFYAYTKRSDLFTRAVLNNKPENLTLIYSIDGIDPKNISRLYDKAIKTGFDKIAVVSSKASTCPAQTENKICAKNCFKCIDKNSGYSAIVFKKH